MQGPSRVSLPAGPCAICLLKLLRPTIKKTTYNRKGALPEHGPRASSGANAWAAYLRNFTADNSVGSHPAAAARLFPPVAGVYRGKPNIAFYSNHLLTPTIE